MDQVIVFDKSLQERFQEYTDVLSDDSIVSVSTIQKKWAFFVELTVDPTGWQAIWKIPRLKCEDLKIPFPTIVLVHVKNVFCTELSALIKILAVQDDISLPDKHIVPLIQLWITKDQDATVVLNLQSMANSLDMLRFFYTNVFMPWDHEEEDTTDWLKKHLESRLRLFYDIKHGAIPFATAEHIKSLITEARRLQARREHILEEIDSDDDKFLNDTGVTENEKLQTLMDLHVQILQIASEMKLLENPLIRQVILRQQQELAPVAESTTPDYWLVAKEDIIEEYLKFLTVVQSHFPNVTAKVENKLSFCLETMKAIDVVVLNRGRHQVKTMGRLESGGALRGIYNANETLVSCINEHVMLNFNGKELLIENVTLDAGASQCALLVRCGKVTLRNCKLIGDGVSSTHQGIIVLANGALELINCELTRFCTAIVGNSGAKITLRKCEIYNVCYGIKIYDNCHVEAVDSSFCDCSEYGFCVESEDQNPDSMKKMGNFELLKIVPGIHVKDIRGQDNSKGDVIINPKPKINPLSDLFSQLSSRSSRKDSISSDEEMDFHSEANNTVIENKKCGDSGSILAA